MIENIEQTMRSLKLGSMAKDWRNVEYRDAEQYMRDLLEIEVRERDCYEQKSLIITSNLEFSQWNTVFGDSKLTAALVDRLIHHSHIVVFSGPGHRLEESIARQRRGGGVQ